MPLVDYSGYYHKQGKGSHGEGFRKATAVEWHKIARCAVLVFVMTDITASGLSFVLAPFFGQCEPIIRSSYAANPVRRGSP